MRGGRRGGTGTPARVWGGRSRQRDFVCIKAGRPVCLAGSSEEELLVRMAERPVLTGSKAGEAGRDQKEGGDSQG